MEMGIIEGVAVRREERVREGRKGRSVVFIMLFSCASRSGSREAAFLGGFEDSFLVGHLHSPRLWSLAVAKSRSPGVVETPHLCWELLSHTCQRRDVGKNTRETPMAHYLGN